MDANTYYLNQYLKELDKEDRRENAINDRVEDLLEEEYYPYTYEALTEALGEMYSRPYKTVDIEKAMEDKDFAALGKLLYDFNQEYWERLARASAEEWIDAPDDDGY